MKKETYEKWENRYFISGKTWDRINQIFKNTHNFKYAVPSSNQISHHTSQALKCLVIIMKIKSYILNNPEALSESAGKV